MRSKKKLTLYTKAHARNQYEEPQYISAKQRLEGGAVQPNFFTQQQCPDKYAEELYLPHRVHTTGTSGGLVLGGFKYNKARQGVYFTLDNPMYPNLDPTLKAYNHSKRTTNRSTLSTRSGRNKNSLNSHRSSTVVSHFSTQSHQNVFQK